MGNALLMMVVREELLGLSALCVLNETGEVVQLETGKGFMDGLRREELLRDHPDAFWVLHVPYAAVWHPPVEPSVFEWYKDARLRRKHDGGNKRSLEAFVNGNLAKLGEMVRTGWWILEHARVRVTEFRSVPQRKPPA